MVSSDNQKTNDCNFIILAAGEGKRMQSNIEKSMHLLDGKPLISYSLDKISRLTDQNFFTVISPNSSQDLLNILAEHLQSIQIEQKEQLGTAHAVSQAYKYIHQLESKYKKNTLILYADTPLITEETIKQMLNSLSEETSCCVLAFQTNNLLNSYGILEIDNDQHVLEIIEHTDHRYHSKKNKDTLYNSGILAISTEVLLSEIDNIRNENSKKEFYLTDIIGLIRKENESKTSYILASEDEVFGINTQEDLEKTKRIIHDRRIDKLLQSGVKILDRQNIYIGWNNHFGSDVVIEPFVHIGNNVTIDDDVLIKSFSYIDSETTDRVHIKSHAKIGPHARIKGGSTLESKSEVGNFVEIKHSTVGAGSKIKHLSYIGNAEIGDNVNIGAGTITCNYDGKDKHQTIIEDNCFIGSNSILVAPITIEEYSITGAGGVFTKHIKKNSLAVSRTKQKHYAKLGLDKSSNNN